MYVLVVVFVTKHTPHLCLPTSSWPYRWD